MLTTASFAPSSGTRNRATASGCASTKEWLPTPRRIAAYTDSRGRRFTLYVVKTDRLALRGDSDAYRQRQRLFSEQPVHSPGSHGAYMSGRHFVGVTANNVTRVVLIGSRGVRHSVPVTEDGGFIHNCRAYNGCASLIVCVQSYDRSNKLLGSEPVMGGRRPT